MVGFTVNFGFFTISSAILKQISKLIGDCMRRSNTVLLLKMLANSYYFDSYEFWDFWKLFEKN